MFRLEESLGFLMNRAASRMRSALEARLKKYGLTAPQWAVLARLWEEDGLSPSEIGGRLFFDRPTITGIIDRLERKGLVNRIRDSKDMRVVKVFLTEKGGRLRKELPPYAAEVNSIALKGFKGPDAEALKGGLRKIIGNLEG